VSILFDLERSNQPINQSVSQSMNQSINQYKFT